MSDKRQLSAGSVATVRKPRVVLVGSAVSTTKVAEQFRSQGWDVFTIPPGDDLACTILTRKPTAVVLPTDAGLETGYLVAAKLRKVKPKLRVALVGTRSPEAERFAKFVGAAFVADADGLDGVLTAITR